MNNWIKACLAALMCMAMPALAGTLTFDTYYHNDHLGSPVAATDERSDLLWRAHFRPYGERQENPKDTAFGNVGYTGHMQDADSGLVYMQQRYYDPMIGRFLAIDPVGVNPNGPASFNRYTYANNNPHLFVDPNGESAVTAFGGLLYESGQFLTGNGFDGAMVAGALADGYNGEGGGFVSAAFDDATSFIPAGAVGGAVIKLARLAKNSIGLKRAETLRNAELDKIAQLSQTQRSKITTVVGAYDPATGRVAVGVKKTCAANSGKCAEDLASEALGNPKDIKFTKVIRPRNETVIPRCDRCTSKFGPED